MTDELKAEHEAFEKWAISISHYAATDENGNYVDQMVNEHWFGWQARAALGQRQEVMDEKSWFKENDEAIATLAYQKLDEELADKLTFERSLEMFPQATYSLCRSAVGNFVIAVLEKYRAALQSIALPQKVVNAPFGNADHIPPVEGVQFLNINNMEPQQAVPDGWQLVPVEATDEMCEAAWESDASDYVGEHRRIHRADLAYKAMLAAAPKPETE